jgi:hypothetical protein
MRASEGGHLEAVTALIGAGANLRGVDMVLCECYVLIASLCHSYFVPCRMELRLSCWHPLKVAWGW